MKRLDAGKFLTINSFPKLKGHELRTEKNKINGVIEYAIGKQFNCKPNNEVDTVEFLRWAVSKKKKGVLRWPWLEACVNLPRIPNSFSGTLVTIGQTVVPSEIKECQDLLLKAWSELAEVQKDNNK